MILGCFAGFVVDFDKLILIGSSVLLAVVLLVILKNFRLSTKFKLGLIYGHLIFLFFPFAVLTTELACGAACMPCANNMGSLVVLALPSTVFLSTLAGFFIIPGFYMFFGRKTEAKNTHIINFVKKYSTAMKINMPKIYIMDNANPVAFSFRSFRSMIFMSAGLLDVLSKKELEAVILHELGHIKRKASVLTMSFSLLRLFSPLSLIARFHHDSSEEEMQADNFVVEAQKTDRHLKSAKRKMDEFEKSRFLGHYS